MQANGDGLEGCGCGHGKVIPLSGGKDTEWSRIGLIGVEAGQELGKARALLGPRILGCFGHSHGARRPGLDKGCARGSRRRGGVQQTRRFTLISIGASSLVM